METPLSTLTEIRPQHAFIGKKKIENIFKKKIYRKSPINDCGFGFHVPWPSVTKNAWRVENPVLSFEASMFPVSGA